MHLIDAQNQQLEDSIKYIEQLRRSANDADLGFGPVHLHVVDTLREVLRLSWLVIEVFMHSQPLMGLRANVDT